MHIAQGKTTMYKRHRAKHILINNAATAYMQLLTRYILFYGL